MKVQKMIYNHQIIIIYAAEVGGGAAVELGRLDVALAGADVTATVTDVSSRCYCSFPRYVSARSLL